MSEQDYLSFKLSDEFVKTYTDIKPNWGFQIGGGNSLGEIVFFNNYSRIKEDGTKERWYETCRRVIEGYYSIMKDHCGFSRTSWNEGKATASAKDAYDRMFSFKWLPPGRGIWAMGTQAVNGERNAAMLYNCAVLTTAKISSHSVKSAVFPFVRLMEMSMNGIGVGFDARGAGNITLHKPLGGDPFVFVVPDTREGWAESLGILLESFFFENRSVVQFDYSQIRPSGAPLKRFGGTASGPSPLIKMHEKLAELLTVDAGREITSQNIVDIMNLAAKAVVAGGSRRSALLALGEPDDKEFINLKNWETYPERNGADGWAYLSNNSVIAEVGGNYDHLVDLIADNGEPGILYLDMARNYGRTGDAPDGKDQNVVGTNPCGEIFLESSELCVSGKTLIHTYDGLIPIKDLVDSYIEIFNGEEWSKSRVFSTGKAQTYRVLLSDGSYLDATADHKWLVKTSRNYGIDKFKEVKTTALIPGMTMPRAELSSTDGGSFVEDSYTWGWFAGDGFIDGKDTLMLIQSDEYLVLEYLNGIKRKEQHPKEYARPFSRFATKVIPYEDAVQLRDHHQGLPESVLSMHSEDLSDFFAGWIDSDGAICGNLDSNLHLRLYGDELKLRQSQMLLRRIGVNYATLTLFAEAGSETNKGIRNQDLWYLTIPSFEAHLIPTKLKTLNETKNRFRTNPAYVDSKLIDRAKRQTVVSIAPLEVEETFCFEESKLHQGLFSNVLTKQCNLSELFPNHHEDINDFKRSIKHAYMYNKAVTLLPTPWPETNEVINRNRRIGLSVSGTVQFLESKSHPEYKRWLEEAYQEVLRRDNQYSAWLGIRESIRHTTSKPSGSVSILAGATPGVHWPTNSIYIRRMRMRPDSEMYKVLVKAGYYGEPDVMDPENTAVIELPTCGPNVRTEAEVTIWEKASIAALVQKHFADNAVSCTITFHESEKKDIGAVLRNFEGQLKSISFLPIIEDGTTYAQMPYEAITLERYEELAKKTKPVNWNKLYDGGKVEDALGDKFCTTDQCEIKF